MRMVAMLVVDFRSHIHLEVKQFDVSITLCHLVAKQTTAVTEIETTNIINTTTTAVTEIETTTNINTTVTSTTTKPTTTNGSYDYLN
jgi:hypothetical protein